MEIIDLSEEYKRLFFVCLEDWSEEIKEAGNHKDLVQQDERQRPPGQTGTE